MSIKSTTIFTWAKLVTDIDDRTSLRINGPVFIYVYIAVIIVVSIIHIIICNIQFVAITMTSSTAPRDT